MVYLMSGIAIMAHTRSASSYDKLMMCIILLLVLNRISSYILYGSAHVNHNFKKLKKNHIAANFT